MRHSTGVTFDLQPSVEALRRGETGGREGGVGVGVRLCVCCVWVCRGGGGRKGDPRRQPHLSLHPSSSALIAE